MQLAYSISGYKQPGQFRWLLEAIYDARDIYAIHIDEKTPREVYDAFVRVAGGRANIHFIERERVTWRGAGLVMSELRAIRFLLERAPGFDYLINLSVQCYPLKTRDHIVAELSHDPTRNYVTMEPLHALPLHVRRRPYLWSFEYRDRLIKTPLPRLVPSSVQVAWKGSWWHILTGTFCRWLVTDTKTETYARYFRHVQAPDEMIVQNLIVDSPFKDTLADRNRHLVIWPGGSPSPVTMTMGHLDMLLGTSLFYARKFDETVDRTVLERLAAHLGVATPEPASAAA